ncbi:hypothetical protein T4C_4329 [Trichinella pseudospiralis]|uniref:Uncharacterized protein n=1 Tax=Trichinella pseudospiralis TaxID=6337 RepID=A0A0V1K1K6_TRIPS|nr:hypothetical protein T4C_4329 [Trichinella pseudospiralis]
MTVLLNPSRMKCAWTQLSYDRLVVGTAVAEERRGLIWPGDLLYSKPLGYINLSVSSGLWRNPQSAAENNERELYWFTRTIESQDIGIKGHK